jgi:hypothetical protein
MAILARSLIEAAARELEDLAFLRWRVNALAQYVNDALSDAVIRRPDLFHAKEVLTLTQGVAQSLGSTGIKLVSVNLAVATGRPITLTPGALLDAQVPSWRSRTPTTSVLHYIWDARSPKEFDVYPPAASGTQVEAEYIKAPPSITLTTGMSINDVTLSIDLPDYLDTALTAFVLHRSYSQRNELADPSKAAAHLQRYAELMGTDVQATLAVGNGPAKNEPKIQ